MATQNYKLNKIYQFFTKKDIAKNSKIKNIADMELDVRLIMKSEI